MPPQSTETRGGRGNERGDESDAPSRARRVLSGLAGRATAAPAALAGGALLVRAARAGRAGRRGRRVGQVLVGGALLGFGIRQWRSSGERTAGDETTGAESESGADEAADDDEGGKVSDEARAAVERTDVLGQAETNPRGTSGEPDVETVTDPDEGEIQFTDEQEADAGPKPHLDREDPVDPRYADADDGAVEVDLSEAAMADEASEATGPDDEQAQPTKTDGTEPELSDPDDVSHVQADVPDGADADDGGTAGGGSEDHETNGNEDATVREKWVEGDDSGS